MRILVMKSVGSIKPRVFLALGTLSLFVLLVSCIPAPPAFTTGIRTQAVFRQAGLFGGTGSLVPGVVISGNMQQPPLGNPGPGPQTDFAFIGPTNQFGFYDHPAARTNARWTIGANFSARIPQCPPATQVFEVPPAGAQLTAVCIGL